MMIGIGTQNARLHKCTKCLVHGWHPYVWLLGMEKESWGLDVATGCLWHNSLCRRYTKKYSRWKKPTTIGVYFDGISGTLSYFIDDENLGVAFIGLNEFKEPLYPIICTASERIVIKLTVAKREFVSIQDRCRAVILSRLNHEDEIEQLDLPKTLKQFTSEGLVKSPSREVSLEDIMTYRHYRCPMVEDKTLSYLENI